MTIAFATKAHAGKNTPADIDSSIQRIECEAALRIGFGETMVARKGARPFLRVDNERQARKLMKIAGKVILVVAGLCVAGSACVGLYLIHMHHAPGRYGRNLEFRVSAISLGNFDQTSTRPEGTDVFSGSQALQISEQGQAPVGFEWLPLSEFLPGQGGGIQPRGITRVITGRECLLVADQPAMMLNHAAGAPQWGVKSVDITSSNALGTAMNTVQIELDYTGARMLRHFTRKYIGHSIAVVADGEVIENFGLLSPMRRGSVAFRFPASEGEEAGKLRDRLMK